MEKSNVKKVISIVALIVILLIVLGMEARATDNDVLNGLLNTGLNNTLNVTNNAANNVTNNTANNVTNKVANNIINNSTYQNINLPKTGLAEDFGMVALIGVCIVSAIYAYIKIKNYNVK